MIISFIWLNLSINYILNNINLILMAIESNKVSTISLGNVINRSVKEITELFLSRQTSTQRSEKGTIELQKQHSQELQQESFDQLQKEGKRITEEYQKLAENYISTLQRFHDILNLKEIDEDQTLIHTKLDNQFKGLKTLNNWIEESYSKGKDIFTALNMKTELTPVMISSLCELAATTKFEKNTISQISKIRELYQDNEEAIFQDGSYINIILGNTKTIIEQNEDNPKLQEIKGALKQREQYTEAYKEFDQKKNEFREKENPLINTIITTQETLKKSHPEIFSETQQQEKDSLLDKASTKVLKFFTKVAHKLNQLMPYSSKESLSNRGKVSTKQPQEPRHQYNQLDSKTVNKGKQITAETIEETQISLDKNNTHPKAPENTPDKNINKKSQITKL